MNVFAPRCPPRSLELPRIVSAARAHEVTAFVGVDEQEPMPMSLPFIETMKLPYTVLFDRGRLQASYGAAPLPETVFVSRDGRISSIVRVIVCAGKR